MMLVMFLLSCWGANTYIVEGTVIEVNPPDEVVVDHEDIDGLMDAMVMAFPVSDAGMLQGLKPGDRILARYELNAPRGELTRIRVTGSGPVPQPNTGPVPLKPGRKLPRTEITTHRGQTLVIGEGQGVGTAITFLYTRCPIPDMCPAITLQLQALQQALADDDDVRIVAITLDPDFDTVEVLSAYAEQAGAGPQWSFGRVAPEALSDLAMYAGMNVLEQGDQIVHARRMVVLDAAGALIERYDDTYYPVERVVTQLRTGGPVYDGPSSGTLTPKP